MFAVCILHFPTWQREAVLKNACAVVPDSGSNFGLEEALEAEADRRAACEGFMGGLLKGGEYAGMRFLLQLARTYALRSSNDPHGSPAVSTVPVQSAPRPSRFACALFIVDLGSPQPGASCIHASGAHLRPACAQLCGQ